MRCHRPHTSSATSQPASSFKGRFTGTMPVRGALQTVLIGGLAAAAAFVIARVIA
jgi:VIT1/CCC1 family predicted Fe2+/Mn2+ transporter